MLRQFAALFVALCLGFAPHPALAVLKGSGGAIGVGNITSGTIDGTAIGGSTPSSGAFTTLTANNLFTLTGVEDSLSAFATGGQTSATALSAAKNYHRVTTVTTAADSVKLPAATVGQAHYVRNDGANSMQVFGTSPDTIDGVATATGVAQAAGTGVWYISTTAAKWTRTANYNPANVAITGGTLTGTNVEYTLAQSSIPFVAGPTGTMANNGAVTWGTALPNAYVGGAWVIMPAGSIAAGVPAATAILWYVGTNTTTGTFYNSTYTSGVPTIGTTTAYATTGPGAFAGVTAETLTVGIQIPANAIGPNGSVVVEQQLTATNNANAKAGKFYFHTANAIAGTTVSNANCASVAQAGTFRTIENRGITSQQVAVAPMGVVGQEGAGPQWSSIDTTAATWINFTLTRGTATDALVLERIFVKIRYGA